MPVTDLTGTTWVLNDTIIYTNVNPIISFDFTSNDTSFYGFYFDVNSDGDNSLGYRTNRQYSFNQIYDIGGNIISGKEAYKTITITGGTDATNSALISWLEANGTLQTPTTSRKSIDLTTLSGWGALSDGNHTITIVAKADGYKDSEPSAAVSVEKAPQEYTDCITFTGESSDFTLKATNKEWDGTVEYSTDHNTWTVWDGSTISSNNKKLYLRGSGNTTFWTKLGARFVLSARARCSGNLNTLLEHSNPPTTLSANCYYCMFRSCTNLTEAPSLPATTLAEFCYESMFYGCTNLTKAPAVLPAMVAVERCYEQMFRDCTSLKIAPTLLATTIGGNCCLYMFGGCTSLTTAPALPATTLKTYCYSNMFNGCTAFKVSKTQTGTYQYAWRIPTSGTASTQTGWNSDMLKNTGGTFKSNPSANTTYYVENKPV